MLANSLHSPGLAVAPNFALLSTSRSVHTGALQRTPAHYLRKSGSRLVVAAGVFGGLFGGKSSAKTCKKCQSKGAIACPGCKGTGKNKKNGNVFERWKCYDCQGFGQVTCPQCGGGKGLTPEQRRER